MYHFQFSPDDTVIDICRDKAFKAAFTTDNPTSQGALRSLISAYIGRKVEALTVIANEPAPADLRDRQIRYDLRVKVDGGELANVEVTLYPSSFEALRFEYYLARLHAGQAVRGGRDYRKLAPAWQINFVSGRKLFSDQWCIHQFEYYDPERGISLGGRTRIIVVELEKVGQLLEKPVERLSAVERWAVFFRYAADPEKRNLVNGLMKAEEGIAMAGEMLVTVTQDEIDQARKEQAYKLEMDWYCDMAEFCDEAREEGLAEGREEGLAKGREEGEAQARREKLEAARKLKDLGVPPEKIAAGLGLSPEEIEAL
jgi:predicted transposase/invertase (TIGR01784 family)